MLWLVKMRYCEKGMAVMLVSLVRRTGATCVCQVEETETA